MNEKEVKRTLLETGYIRGLHDAAKLLTDAQEDDYALRVIALADEAEARANRDQGPLIKMGKPC